MKLHPMISGAVLLAVSSFALGLGACSSNPADGNAAAGATGSGALGPNAASDSSVFGGINRPGVISTTPGVGPTAGGAPVNTGVGPTGSGGAMGAGSGFR